MPHHASDDGNFPKKKQRSLEEMAVTHYLNEENCTFTYENGFLYLTYQDKKQRVSLYRAFPYDRPDTLISAMNSDEEEVGFISDLALFSEKTRALLEAELNRRYFIHEITEVLFNRERFGFSFWTVKTKEGKTEFTLKDPFKSIYHTLDDKLIFTDVDGNRFEIPAVSRLDKKSHRFVEIYL